MKENENNSLKNKESDINTNDNSITNKIMEIPHRPTKISEFLKAKKMQILI